jgi:hypothetical protein
MEDVKKSDYLKDEYLLIQRFYEDFDARIMKIKGWSATIAIAAIGAGFYKTNLLWLFSAGASLVFWILEATWKNFQYLYAPRIEEIEEVFREEKFDNVAPFQVGYSWYNEMRKRGIIPFRTFFLGIVLFPHFVTFIIGLFLFITETVGLISITR